MIAIRSFLAASLAILFMSPNSNAAPLRFTQEFRVGFNVSINGSALAPSGPITIAGVVDDATADIDPDSAYGEFPLLSAQLTGSGFVNRTITTPLSLLIFDTDNFGFQRLGAFNTGITGWNGSTPAGDFISDVNSLATLGTLPYSTVGNGTFWFDGLNTNAWTLDLGGDTIGGNIGNGGPAGVFTIERIPEPGSFTLITFGLVCIAWRSKS